MMAIAIAILLFLLASMKIVSTGIGVGTQSSPEAAIGYVLGGVAEMAILVLAGLLLLW